MLACLLLLWSIGLKSDIITLLLYARRTNETATDAMSPYAPGGLVERRETSGQHDALIYNNLVEQLKCLTYEQARHQDKHTEEMSQIENTKNKTDGKIAVLEEQFEEVHSKISQESFSLLITNLGTWLLISTLYLGSQRLSDQQSHTITNQREVGHL